MNGKIYTVDEIKERFAKVAEQYPIEEAYLFGSYARKEAKKRSDVDIAVEIKKNARFSLWDLSGLFIDAKKIFEKKVDIVECGAITGGFKEEVEKDLVKIYG